MNQLDLRKTTPPLFEDRDLPPQWSPPPPPPARLGLFEVLREDLGRYVDLELRASKVQVLRALLDNEGVLPLFAYRLGRWLLEQRGARGLRRALFAVLWLVQGALETVGRLLFDIRLDLGADIGPGFYVGHFKSIYVGPGVRIGRSCNIGQMCFVCASASGSPVVGDRVYLGVGAKVMGRVRVGDDVAVGANAVVLEDAPAKAVLVGNPARVVSFKGSEDFISIKKRDGALGPPAPQLQPQQRPRAEVRAE
jgi:serine O-acetyltransferase